MILCTRCGHQSGDDDGFCSGCGAYLDWFGEHVTPPEPETEPEPEPEPEPAPAPPPTLGQRVRTAVRPRRDAGPGGPGAPPSTPISAAPPRAVIAPPRPAGAWGPEGLAGPVTTTPVLRPAPAAVRPGQMKGPVPRTVAAAPEPVIPPGGPVCHHCSARNAPGRRFCGRCGEWLDVVTVIVEPRPPWWKRAGHWLVARLVPPPSLYRAGERPTRRSWSVPRRLLTSMMALALLVVVVVPGCRRAVTDRASRAYDDVVDAATHSYAPVRPVKLTATSSTPGHGPALAIDGLSNSYWSEAAPGDGEGQVLTFTFDPPVNLDRVIMRTGASGTDDAFLSQPRPRVLHVVYDSGGTDELTLEDVPGEQSVNLHARQVSEVAFEITLVHRSAVGHDCSISEIEFFTRK